MALMLHLSRFSWFIYQSVSLFFRFQESRYWQRMVSANYHERYNLYDNSNPDNIHTTDYLKYICVLIGFCVFAVIGVTMTVVCWVRSDQHKVLPASPRKSDKLSGGEKERKFPLSRPSSQLAIGTVELELQQQPLTTRELENLPTREILDAKKEEKTSEQSKETRARSGSLPLYSPAARPRTDTQLSENSPLRSTSHFTYSTEKPTPFNKTSSYNSQSSYPESPAVECTPSCVFMFKKLACNVIPVWCSFITCRISNAKKPKDTEFKAKDAENLDKQNMRDVQLSEYEKRKRQMKELDNQQEEPPDDHLDESDDGGELDEITAVQSQPLEEETIVNPNFIHHYIPRSGSRSGSIRGH
ncbi:hypothetical protein ACHWQZ_G016880 [Mnemiopsis leidyi]